MRQIEIKVLTTQDELDNMLKLSSFAAKLTQHGHEIHDMATALELYDKPLSSTFVQTIANLPHPTLRKFGVINVLVVGCSRRFVAQITRHQNEVKFMASSLQYSNFDNYTEDSFVIPYDILDSDDCNGYINSCMTSMQQYVLLNHNIKHDDSAYCTPQGLRQVILISAEPYEWMHMISQRICRRNTDETRYIMLRIWQVLEDMLPAWFNVNTCGADCMRRGCEEGKMSCKHVMTSYTHAAQILDTDFSKITRYHDE